MPAAARASLFVVLLLVFSAGCGGSSGRFSETNARAHLNMLAGTIGSRPVGTIANRRARDYLIDQLRLFGFDVRVQDADAARPDFGVTARVSNIIAAKAGARADAIALVAHYDSVAAGPGGTDDGLGVAVVLELARLLAARQSPSYSLIVALTDGEEAGLMGAAALVEDAVFKGRTRAVLNFESIGSSGPSFMFETAAARDLVHLWAGSPDPHGTSIGFEVYKRLPNDTDFTILRRLPVAGLNFAPIGDSYAYHTARDTADRVSSYTIRQTGETALAIVEALDGRELGERAEAATYFDLNGRGALAYGSTVGRILTIAAIVLGLVACWKLFRRAARRSEVGRLLFTAGWLLAGFAAAVAAMWGATWTLRAARESYHPWYAQPDRLIALLFIVSLVVCWALVRLAAWLPRAVRASSDPAFIWAVALPVWIALAAFMEWNAQPVAYLWTVPALAAAVVLSGLPAGVPVALRAGSIAVLAVAGTLWIPLALTLMRFAVAQFGRLPIVAPSFVHAALMGAAMLMLGPPLASIIAPRERPLERPSVVTAALMVALAIAAGLAYGAPAYDYARPARRQAQYVYDEANRRAYWEVGGLEPGLDLALGPEAPHDWTPSPATFDTSVPIPRIAAPFRFTAAAENSAVPGVLRARVRSIGGATELEITAQAEAPSTVTFVLPPGVTPSSANLPGGLRGTRWAAAYIAPPPEGVLFRASIAGGDVARLGEGAVVLSTPRLPGGTGWQGLTAWMPQERAVWTAAAVYIQPLGPLLAGAASSATLR